MSGLNSNIIRARFDDFSQDYLERVHKITGTKMSPDVHDIAAMLYQPPGPASGIGQIGLMKTLAEFCVWVPRESAMKKGILGDFYATTEVGEDMWRKTRLRLINLAKSSDPDPMLSVYFHDKTAGEVVVESGAPKKFDVHEVAAVTTEATLELYCSRTLRALDWVSSDVFPSGRPY